MKWSEFEWEDWRKVVNNGVWDKVPKSRWKSYDDAVRLCGLISKAFGEPYTLESLAGFMKLAAGRLKVKSHSGEIKWPERPSRVTIARDLEMVPRPAITVDLGMRPAIIAVKSELEMDPRPLKISWTHRAAAASGALCRFATMRTFLLSLDIKTHFALSQCGRVVCPAGWLQQPLARDAQLYYWVSRFLHVDGPHGVELQRRGMGMGCLARAVASAWGWLDAMQGLPFFHNLLRVPLLGAVVAVRITLSHATPESTQARRIFYPMSASASIDELEDLVSAFASLSCERGDAEACRCAAQA